MIYTAYAERENMTFIMKEWEDDNGTGFIDCIGWYFGEPNETDTEEFSHNLVCHYEKGEMG